MNITQEIETVFSHVLIVRIDDNALEETIDRLPHIGERRHGVGEIFGFYRTIDAERCRRQSIIKDALLLRFEERIVDIAIQPRFILLLLDAHDVVRPSIASEKVGAIIAGKERLQRLNPGEHTDQIVVAGREYGADQIVTHARGPQMHLQTIAEEG